MEFKNLKEITTKIASGSTPRGGKNSYTDSGPIALIRSQNIYNNNFTRNGLVYINNEQAKKLSNVEINKDDILINITGDSVARVTMVDSTVLPARINQHVMILRPEESMVNKYYLLAYLSSNIAQESLKHLASDGATRAALTKRDLETFKIPNLSFENQEYIGNLLKYINKKIEVNKNIIANLEELSQTLFKRWFVDFEFPDENSNPYKSSGGEMIDSELGKIPLSWKVQKLNDIFKINYGKNLPTKKILNNGYPVFGGNGIIGYYSNYMYETPKILISCRGAASGKIHISKEKSFVTNNSIVLDEKQKNYFYYFKELYKYNDFKRYTTGSAQPQITIANIKYLVYLTPNTNIIDQFNSKVSCLFNQKNNCEDENQDLAELRDTLLPKLMSGELEIPDDIEVNEDELSI